MLWWYGETMNDQVKNPRELDDPPKGVRSPRSLREARRRRDKVLEAIKDMELQLADPNVTNRDGKRLSYDEWEQQRSRTLRALRRVMREKNYLTYWIKETQFYVTSLEAGTENYRDPNAHLNTSLRLMRSIRKCEALPKKLHDKTGRVADAVEDYLLHNSKIA